MSFILDALRKSETERQRDAAPNLVRTPFATVRRETPGWVWLLVGLLSLALVALGAAWWRDGSPTTADDTRIAGLASSGPESGGRATPVLPSASSSPSPSARVAETEPTGPVRSLAELAEIDPALPAYRLELLAFDSSNPARGSAWINGRRYFPGERIDTGPEVAEIRANGVVLAHRGERFLLTVR